MHEADIDGKGLDILEAVGLVGGCLFGEVEKL